MLIRHNGFCQALGREIEIEIEYIETSDLERAGRTFQKGLISCRERINHSKDECTGCVVAEKAPKTYSIS